MYGPKQLLPDGVLHMQTCFFFYCKKLKSAWTKRWAKRYNSRFTLLQKRRMSVEGRHDWCASIDSSNKRPASRVTTRHIEQFLWKDLRSSPSMLGSSINKVNNELVRSNDFSRAKGGKAWDTSCWYWLLAYHRKLLVTVRLQLGNLGTRWIFYYVETVCYTSIGPDRHDLRLGCV